MAPAPFRLPINRRTEEQAVRGHVAGLLADRKRYYTCIRTCTIDILNVPLASWGLRHMERSVSQGGFPFNVGVANTKSALPKTPLSVTVEPYNN